MSEVTRILESLEPDDPRAADELLPLVYDELRKLAAARMAGERSDHTLQATALVHEAWIRLAGAEGEAIQWNGRRHFLAAAAEAMRRILIDHARRRMADKRGGDWLRVTFGEHASPMSADPAELIDLNAALEQLAEDDPQEAELAELRLFAGLTVPEAAAALGVSTATVNRRWSYVKARLSRDLRRGDTNDQEC
jgi:RNA polymerase sigma factor (TIGR02999 family)